MADNKMFQLHPGRCQETGKGWQVMGKVRLWQGRNGAEKGEFVHKYTYIQCQGSAWFGNSSWYIEFMARTAVNIVRMARTNCIYLNTVT
jgi:hypothetical protein